MSEWDTKITKFVRNDVNLSFMSYKYCDGIGWRKVIAVYPKDMPDVSHVWWDAEERHDEFVRIVEAMGFTVTSDKIDGKEKAPEAAVTALGAKNNISP